MQSEKAINLTIITVSVLAVLAVSGLAILQQVGNNSPNSQKVIAENSSPTPHDHNTMEGWKEYRHEPYGLSFYYPESWQVKVERVQNHEDQPNLLIINQKDQLVLGLYSYRDQDDACTTPAFDIEPQPEITIGGNSATVMATCSLNDTWIGARTRNDQFISISANFVGQPYEADARMLVDSLTGLTLPIIN